MAGFSEDIRVKIPALTHLTRIGYTYRSLRSLHLGPETNIDTDTFSKKLHAYKVSDTFVSFENEFQREFNSSEPAKFYAHMKLTGETKPRRLSLVNLLDRGLMGVPMGAVNLSRSEFKELLEHINDNF